MTKFRLSDNYINKYKRIKPPFGWNGMGEIIYMRTYSRIKDDGKNEHWWETVQRVVEGTYNIQKEWIDLHGLGWNAWQAQNSAQEMYDRMFNMKFLPPGRGLWAMGTKIVEERGLYAALNNCSFVSTENIKEEPAKPFTFLMDMSMLGVGVGFDTRGAGKIIIKGTNKQRTPVKFVIPDSREGWVQSVEMLLMSYFFNQAVIEFDYTQIRKKGSPIKTFGGVAPGPKPLIELHKELAIILEDDTGKPISSTNIVDIQNLIGKCVVSGNIRRSAEIAFGEILDKDYLDLKDYDKNPRRAAFGWASNNSIFAEIGMDYTESSKRTCENGEPGYAWLEQMRKFGRLSDPPNWKDKRVAGGNPCLEQSLEPWELCCLVENFIDRHDSLEDFLRTLKFSYLYAKTVTLGKTHWPETNKVMLRNRRIGCSLSGVSQFVGKRGISTLVTWLEKGYKTVCDWDEIYSDWLCVNQSIKKTSIKPSGTISLVAGSTPGMHWNICSRWHIRRVRLADDSHLLEPLREAGYFIEKAVKEPNTLIVEIPVDAGVGVRSEDDVSMWEQLKMASLLQRYWSDNQVSCTVKMHKNVTPGEIKTVLEYFQYELKGISFLPKDTKKYVQPPYESITEEEYLKRVSKLKKPNFRKVAGEEADVEKFCDGDSCIVQR